MVCSCWLSATHMVDVKRSATSGSTTASRGLVATWTTVCSADAVERSVTLAHVAAP